MMPHTGDYDVMLQFEQDLLNDILARVLDDPLTLALGSPRVLQRRLAYPMLPPNARVLLWWDQPAYMLEGSSTPEAVIVSLPVHGGIRQQQTIYSVDGVVQVSRPVQVSTDAAGTIYLALQSAHLAQINLAHLRFHRAKAPQPTHAVLVGAQADLVAALLLLLPQLATVPVSYAIGSLALPLATAQPAPTPAPAPAGVTVPARSAGAIG